MRNFYLSKDNWHSLQYNPSLIWPNACSIYVKKKHLHTLKDSLFVHLKNRQKSIFQNYKSHLPISYFLYLNFPLY